MSDISYECRIAKSESFGFLVVVEAREHEWLSCRVADIAGDIASSVDEDLIEKSSNRGCRAVASRRIRGDRHRPVPTVDGGIQ